VPIVPLLVGVEAGGNHVSLTPAGDDIDWVALGRDATSMCCDAFAGV
jgi:hypothetical protein